jgi:ParB family chromosome partitioning protein
MAGKRERIDRRLSAASPIVLDQPVDTVAVFRDGWGEVAKRYDLGKLGLPTDIPTLLANAFRNHHAASSSDTLRHCWMALRVFARFAVEDGHVVGIQPIKTDLAAHADRIKDTPAGKAWADRHANWARQMPRDVTALWTFVAGLDHDSRMALFAYCVALTVNAVRLPWERRSSRTMATVDKLAETVSLDMTGNWRATVRTYLGRITKARILEAVREGVTVEAADQMANMKKQGMAEAAEQLAGTGWLPALLRTTRAAQGPAESPQADAVTEPKGTGGYSIAAE